jgi:hypothetical protein
MDFIINSIDWKKAAEFILGKDHTEIQTWIDKQKAP